MKWVIKIALGLLLIYLSICMLAYVKQRDMLYFPPANYLTPPEVGIDDMEVRLFSVPFSEKNYPGDGGFEAWYLPPKGNKPVVMFFHGNGSAIYSNNDIYRDLINNDYGLWAVGYHGYPPSIGKPSQEGIVRAARLQHEALLENGISENKVVLFGTSLGAGVAAQIAKDVKPSMIIMDAPFNSALDMGKEMMPFLPVGLLMKDTYESDKALEGLDVPLVWLHGTNDQIIPIAQGQKLYDGYGGPKTAHIIEGGQHTNLWFLGGREIVLEALASQ